MATYYLDSSGNISKKKQKKKNTGKTYVLGSDGNITLKDDDIAPVRTDTSKEEKWYNGWFNSGEFKDGYQFGDVTKTILGTAADVSEDGFTGVIGMGEKTIDTLATISPYIAQGQYYQNGGMYQPLELQKMQEQVFQQTKKDVADFVKKDLYDEQAVAKEILSSVYSGIYLGSIAQNGGQISEKDLLLASQMKKDSMDYLNNDMENASILGEKSDSLVQSAGQLLATAGLQAAGIPWWLTTGATSLGAESESALNQGATLEQATMSGLISAGAEILTEKISGGISFGGNTLDDALTKKLSRSISNKFVRNGLKMGLDFTGEGAEEVLSSALGKFGQALYKEENLGELLTSEEAMNEYIESFIGGGILGGVSSVSSAIQSSKTNTDFVSGLTNSEKAVVDKVYKDSIAEQEANGEKLSNKEKKKLYDVTLNALEKGYIDTDTIESVLGGETYNTYKSISDKKNALQKEVEDSSFEYNALDNTESGKLTGVQKRRYEELGKKLPELREQLKNYDTTSNMTQLRQQLDSEMLGIVQGSKLSESYNEKARKSQKFGADLSKYDTKQQEVVKKAIESGILNNTNRTHDFVDMIAKISAEKGVLFDFTNNKKLKNSGFAVEGKTVNGFVDGNGNISLNIDSAKSLNSVVGHEITHVLEGTEFYNELKFAIKQYAQTKGEYKKRHEALTQIYDGMDADIEAEITADLVGDYLFTDSDFINRLSTENPNIFKRIFDEIKYLYKVATAGSKEAKELEKVKRAFEKAYRESSSNSTGTKYSVSETTDGRLVAVVDNDILSGIDTGSWDDNKKETAKKIASDELKRFKEGIVVDGITRKVNKKSRDEYTRSNYTESLYKRKSDIFADKMRAASVIDDIVIATTDWSNDGGLSHERTDNFVDFDHGNVLISSGNSKYAAEVVVGITKNGDAVFYDVVDIKPATFEIKKMESSTNTTTQDAIGVIHEDSINGTVTQESEDVKYSLSDSEGNQLSKEQQQYFKDSKMRDDNGSLKVMYHGSENAGFHTFRNRFSDDGQSFFFVDDNEVAKSYSGIYETYEAKTLNTTEDLNNFFAEINQPDYEAKEENGQFVLYEDGDEIATSDSAKGLYDEFRDWTGDGYGSANYKVYLNLTNPLVVDVKGNGWNEISTEFSQDFYDRLQTLTDSEKNTLKQLAAWDDISIFRDELKEAFYNARNGSEDTYTKNLASVYEKLGKEEIDMYRLNDITVDNFTEKSMRKNAVKELNTRDYSKMAKEQGYDGVIFKNVIDNGAYASGIHRLTSSTVAVAFDSNQIKSVANAKPTSDADIRYSISGVNSLLPNSTMLLTAEHMLDAGADSNTVRQETGWYKGYDGKMRFEIDDSKSELIENPNLETHSDNGSTYYTGKLSDILNHSELYEAYPQLKNVNIIIQQTEPGISGIWQPNSNYITLSEELFKRYTKEYSYLLNNASDEIKRIEQSPEYQEYNKWFEDKSLSEKLGAEKWLEEEKKAREKFYSSEIGKRYHYLNWGRREFPFDKKFELGWSKEAKAVLMHEVQHAIQKIENFASGSNTAYWQQKIDAGYTIRTKEMQEELRSLYREYDNIFATKPEFFNEMTALIKTTPDMPRGRIDFDTLEQIEEDPIEWQEFDKWRDSLEEKYGTFEVFDFMTLSHNIKEAEKNTLSPSDAYHFTAGEIEARDVEKRLDYTPEQRKSIEPNIHSKNVVFAENNIRYSISGETDKSYLDAVNRGDMAIAQKMVDELAEASMPDSKIRDNNGKLIPVYHGTNEMFNVFDTSIKGGVNGTAEGFGIYTSDDTLVTSNYGDNQIKMYANITRPASSSQRTITRTELSKLIEDTCRREAEILLEDGYDSVSNALMDTWISNYVNTYNLGINRAYRETANEILRTNDNDMDIIREIMNGMGIRDYESANDFYHDSLIPITGFDGFITQWDNSQNSNIILAIDSSQLKKADAVTYDDNGNVIPLSERFNARTPDIRYSLSDGNIKTTYDNYSYGESFYTISYTQDGKTVGTLRFGEFEGIPNVKMVEVLPEYRRQGIGTKLLQELQRQYPNTEIEFGMSTPDGTKLLENATYTVDNKELIEKFNRYEEVKRKLAEYDAEYEKFFNDEIELPENYAPDYEALQDEEYRLSQELRGKKKTQTFVKNSLSTEEDIAPIGSYNVYGKDIALPTAEPVEPFTQDYAPMSDLDVYLRDAKTENEHYFPDDIAPMSDEELTNGEFAEHMKPADPFADKDIWEDGKNRKVNAYMYDNPEVKPFFQEEARLMLGELDNSVKGEKMYNDQLYYDTNGEQGFFGTKRFTSEEIAYLLDTFNYTYKDIAKGLRAIIEDHGAENNAISKRIEFLLDERLRLGYRDFWFGDKIPPNQEYINLLNSKEITTYDDESWNNWLRGLSEEDIKNYFSAADPQDIAPIRDDIPLYDAKAGKGVVEGQQSMFDEEFPELAKKRRELTREYNLKKSQLESEIANKDKFFSARAKELYNEITNLKKGVRASRELGYLLDYNYTWNETKRALLNIVRSPANIVDTDTSIESLAREMINEIYEEKSYELDDLTQQYQENLKNIEEESKPKPITRQELHGNIINNIKAAFSENGYDLDKVLKEAKNLFTFTTVDSTPQRVMEKALGYKKGQILSDLTVNKVAQNETEGIRWLNSFTNRKNGLLAQLSKQYKIKPGSKESAAAQMYAEGFYVNEGDSIVEYGDLELAKDFPDPKVQENIKGLARDPRIRQVYDETLEAINESRRRNGYAEIPRLDNYFLHFRAMDDTYSKIGLPFNPNDIRAKDLPTDLNGVTADLKPGQPYFSSAMHREGKRTSFDLLGGMERYLTSAKNQIYHIDDIQTLRALRNYIADTYGRAHGLDNLDELSDAEAEYKIKEVYDGHLSTFAKFLNEEANVLAGKTSLVDRGVEGIVGRRGLTFLNDLNQQVGSNMVGLNISSSLTNFLAPAQAFAKTNKVDFVKAFAQTTSNKIGSIFGKNDGFAEQSPVMIRRKGADRFYRTPYRKVADTGYILMSAIDDISTELIARTKYNELTRKGMDSQKAHYETDKWVSRLMGDRSLGQQPHLFNSKTLGMITKFQLEVRNQLDSQFYDTIQEAKVSNEDIQNGLERNMRTAAKVTSTFVQLAVVQHLFGKAFESVAGYNPAFDIIEALIKAFGFDDDEESEDTVLDNIEQGFLTMVEDLPYTSTFTGGRIPISSALPIKELVTGKDEYGNDKSRLKTISEAAPYYILPTGYGQIKKTVQGLGMFYDDLPISGSYTNSGNLRFPVEDTLPNRIQAGIFGQYANDNARYYFDNDIAPLKEKQIEEFVDLDLPIKDYWDYREGLSGKKTLEDKFEYIANLPYSVEQKNIMINNIVDRKEDVDMSNYDEFADFEEFDFYAKNTEKYNFLQDNGISYAEYIYSDETKEEYDNIYSWWKNYPEKVTLSKAVTSDVIQYKKFTSELNDIRADQNSRGESISGSAKAKKINYINSLDLDYGQKLILYRTYYDSKTDKQKYNAKIVEYLNNREDISYEEMVTILEELDMTVLPDGTVTW